MDTSRIDDISDGDVSVQNPTSNGPILYQNAIFRATGVSPHPAGDASRLPAENTTPRVMELDLSMSATDGRRIPVRGWAPDAHAGIRSVVQIVHGMGEHSARYAELGCALAREGHAVYASDLRGHGASAAIEDALGDLGAPHGWASTVDDLLEVGRELGRRHPDAPRVWLGHSMGSVLVRDCLVREPRSARGVVLSGPPGASAVRTVLGQTIARLEQLRLGSRGSSPLLARLLFGGFDRPFRPARTGYDWLSRDPHEVDAYVSDPLCGFVLRPRSLAEMLAALRRLDRPASLAAVPRDLPILILGGSEDPVPGGARGLRRIAQRLSGAGFSRVELRIHPGARHEVLHETHRMEVFAEIARWIDAALP